MSITRIAGLWLTLCAAVLSVLALAPSPAYAGNWMQVSCVNPNGSAAPSQGWTSYAQGSPGGASAASTSCGPGSPMESILAVEPPPMGGQPVLPPAPGSAEVLQYTPPSGSMLTGGSVQANLFAGTTDSNSSTGAYLYSPALSAGDAFYRCSPTSTTVCTYSGALTLPANLGGDLYLSVWCMSSNGGPTPTCPVSPADNDDLASTQVASADLLLSTGATPAGTGFAGTLLSPNAKGTAEVSFTASDPSGPGVYQVRATIDGAVVYDTTPETNSGECVPVGTNTASGALMFDYQQPCPTTEPVGIPVDTAELTNGTHQLTVTVTDAAQTTVTVLSRTITTDQAGTPGTTGQGTTATATPQPHHVKATLEIFSRYRGAHTRIITIKAHNLPADARITVRCRGRHCPRPSAMSASAKNARRLWKALTRETFTAGDRETFTFTAPGLLTERSAILFRKDAKPIAQRL